MKIRAQAGVHGGAFLVVVALPFFVQAFGYGIGSPRSMQAGFFPMAISAAMIVVGAAIAIGGLLRGGDPVLRPAWRAWLAITASMAAFALAIVPLGLMPAVALAVVVAVLADRTARPLGTIVLIAGLCAGVWLVFSVGLGLPIPAIRGIS